MPTNIDVFQMLRSFASRNNLSEIKYHQFVKAVASQAVASKDGAPIFAELAKNPEEVLLPRIQLLAKQHRIVLKEVAGKIKSIYLLDQLTDCFAKVYRQMDLNPAITFPAEGDFDMVLSPETTQEIQVALNLSTFLDSQIKIDKPLCRIVFANDLRSMIIPSEFVSKKLLEYCILKLQHYLNKGTNKEFIQGHVQQAMPKYQSLSKEAIAALATKLSESLASIKNPDNDFTYSFWAYLISAIRKDISKETIINKENLSILQACTLCEFFVNYYKSRVQSNMADVMALRFLLIGMTEKPLYFSLPQILEFKTDTGKSLSSRFDEKQIQGVLQNMISSSGKEILPKLYSFTHDDTRYYVLFDKLAPLVVRLIHEANIALHPIIVKKWTSLLHLHKSIPAMQNTQLFSEQLHEQLAMAHPTLSAILRQGFPPAFLANYKPAMSGLATIDLRITEPERLADLLLLSNTSLATEARLALPFWYGLPVLGSITRLLNRLTLQPKKQMYQPPYTAKKVPLSNLSPSAGLSQPSDENWTMAEPVIEKAEADNNPVAYIPQENNNQMKSTDVYSTEISNANGGDEVAKIINTKAHYASTAKEKQNEAIRAVSRIAESLLPEGYDLDAYLKDLENRWNPILNPKAKANLTLDVEGLIRDHLRRILRTSPDSLFTLERIRNLSGLISRSEAFSRVKNRQALDIYIQIYLTKLLGAKSQPKQ